MERPYNPRYNANLYVPKLTEAERQACDAINGPGNALVNFHNTAGWMKAR